MAKNCGQLDWVNEDSRTQGGGWIWFPAKGESPSLSVATLKAEGGALEYLKGECGIIPENTKFNERCIEKSNGKYVVHIRAAIHQKYCNANASVSSELTKRLVNYQSMNALNQVNQALCNNRTPENCFLEANKEWKSQNIVLAMTYSDLGCKLGDTYSCGFLGYLHFELGNAAQARKHLSYACNRDIEISCTVLKDLEAQLKRI